MIVSISKDYSPALGDIRALSAGDTIVLRPGVEKRKAWSRISDAIMVAVTRGADCRWVR